MPMTFKNRINVHIVRRTPTEDLVYCEVCGGINTRARTAAKVDCANCDGTGYENLYEFIPVPAAYIPGPQKRWNATTGGVDYFGECTIKLDAGLKEVLSDAEYIQMDGANWAFTILREHGAALGQPRLLLSLSRK